MKKILALTVAFVLATPGSALAEGSQVGAGGGWDDYRPDRFIVTGGFGDSDLLGEYSVRGNNGRRGQTGRRVPPKGPGSETLLEDGVQGLNNASRFGIGAEWEVFHQDGLSIDLGLGLSILNADNLPSHSLGVDTSVRVNLVPENKISPYFIFTASYDEMASNWGDATVGYGFTNTFGFGLSYDLTKETSLYVDYRWLHNSNGSTFHSDEFRDAFGLDKDSGSNRGFETGILTIGYSWDF